MRAKRREANKVGTGNISRGKKEPRSLDTGKLKDTRVAFVSRLIFAALEKSTCPVKRPLLAPSFLRMACGGLRGGEPDFYKHVTLRSADGQRLGR